MDDIIYEISFYGSKEDVSKYLLQKGSFGFN